MAHGPVTVGDEWESKKVSISVEAQPYDPAAGVATWWDEDAKLRVEVWTPASVVISGNREGLRSLARHLLTLAQDSMPNQMHMDIDEYHPTMVDGSLPLRIELDR